MESSLSVNRFSASALLICILLFPYLFLVWNVDQWSAPSFLETVRALRFTSLQAALSATFSLAIGVWGARGLLFWTRSRGYFEALVIIPGTVPTLFAVLSLLKLVNPFPFGLTGIVLAHTVLNSGLVTLAVARLFESRVAGWAELALVEGATPKSFFLVVARYLARDFSLIWLFVFSICFSSFAVPLMLGGFDGTTFEVLIYEKIRIGGSWSEALGLSVLQTVLMISLASLLGRQPVTVTPRSSVVTLLASRWGVIPPLVFSVCVLGGLLGGLPGGLEEFRRLGDLSSELRSALVFTLAVGAGTGLFVGLLLLLAAWSLPHDRYRSFLRGFVAPSAVLTGFACLFVFGKAPLGAMVIGISLISFPMLYRLQLDGLLEALRSQSEIARTLGATWGMTFFHIIVPQIAPTLGFLGGLAAFWACGEFAISGILASGTKPLAVLVRDLAGSYRLDAASVLVWPIMVCGLTLWFIFWRLGRVAGRKSYL